MNDQKRYVVYCRKSTDRDDKQIQSLETQEEHILTYAIKNNLTITTIYKEAHSAKRPNRRPIWDQVLKDLRTRKANCLLVYTISRCSRNPQESGILQQLLVDRVIQEIRTLDQVFMPEDNQLMFALLSSLSSQASAELAKATLDGMVKKAKSGQPVNKPPIGYTNHLETKECIPDPDRFTKVRHLFDLALKDKYSLLEISEIANKKLHLVPLRKKEYATTMGPATVHSILTNIFYTGVFKFNGTQYEGKYTPMITKGEHDKIRYILSSKKEGAKAHTKDFKFSNLIRCGHCGVLMVAEDKIKILKRDGRKLHWNYYRCSRSKNRNDYTCPHVKYYREELIESQFLETLSKITVDKDLAELAIEAIKDEHRRECQDHAKIAEKKRKEVADLEAKLKDLLTLRLNKCLNDNEYMDAKQNLSNQLALARQSVSLTDSRFDTWVDKAERAFNFCIHAKEEYEKGGTERKKEILQTLGSRWVIKDGQLVTQLEGWVKGITDINRLYVSNFGGTPTYNPSGDKQNKTKGAFPPPPDTWRPRQDLNLRPTD